MLKRKKLGQGIASQQATDGALSVVALPATSLVAGVTGLVVGVGQGIIGIPGVIAGSFGRPLFESGPYAGVGMSLFLVRYPPAILVFIPVYLAKAMVCALAGIVEHTAYSVARASAKTFHGLPKGLTEWTCCKGLGSWAEPCSCCGGENIQVGVFGPPGEEKKI